MDILTDLDQPNLSSLIHVHITQQLDAIRHRSNYVKITYETDLDRKPFVVHQCSNMVYIPMEQGN